MYDFRLSQRWLWRMSSSGMWRCVDLASTDVSEERIASIFSVEKSWVNARSVTLNFSPLLTDTLTLMHIPLLPAVDLHHRPHTPLHSVVFPCDILSLSPCSYIAGCFWLVAQSAATCSRCSPFADFSTLKMEAIRSSETSVDARSTQRHIPEDDILLKY
jgi:hypothetical protein